MWNCANVTTAAAAAACSYIQIIYESLMDLEHDNLEAVWNGFRSIFWMMSYGKWNKLAQNKFAKYEQWREK